MKDCVVVIQSYNRYYFLKLMQEYLKDIWSDIYIFDDGSTDPRIAEEFDIHFQDAPHDKLTEMEANSRCGLQRGRIVDWFLKTGKQYLLWVDDDIVVTPDTLQSGLNDMRDMEQYCTYTKPGLYSFHTWMKTIGRFHFRKDIYGLTSLTGESCCIMNKQMFEDVGNYFGPEKYGYLDNHVKEMRKSGYHIVCRLTNPWPVQHIGIHDTSFIHTKKKYWHGGLWRSYEVGHDYLRPDGFIPEKYMSMVKESGARYAPKKYREYLLEDSMKDKNKMEKKKSNVSDCMNKDFDVKGNLDVIVHRGSKDGEVVDERHVENLVVNNAIVVMAHLLAGDDMSDYYVDRMQFGTGTTAAVATDTTLEAGVTPIKDISSHSFPDSTSVQFVAYLLEDEANGFAITEAGLRAANCSPDLVARTVFGALNKSNDFVFEFRWTIYWTTG